MSERVMSGVVGLDGNVVVRMVGLSGCVTDGGGLCGNVVVVTGIGANVVDMGVVVAVAVVTAVLNSVVLTNVIVGVAANASHTCLRGAALHPHGL